MVRLLPLRSPEGGVGALKASNRPEILERANHVCELCYGPLSSMSVHHRRPRQMGGTKAEWINSHENLLALCGSGTTGCHGHVESRRQDAYGLGWLLRHGMDPAFTPFCDLRGNWWLLFETQKLPLTLPFDAPNPSSINTSRGVALPETPREENNDRPY